MENVFDLAGLFSFSKNRVRVMKFVRKPFSLKRASARTSGTILKPKSYVTTRPIDRTLNGDRPTKSLRRVKVLCGPINEPSTCKGFVGVSQLKLEHLCIVLKSCLTFKSVYITLGVFVFMHAGLNLAALSACLSVSLFLSVSLSFKEAFLNTRSRRTRLEMFPISYK